MFRFLKPFMVALFILASSCEQAWAEAKIALIIGNGAYPKVGNLTNPPNDAKLMATTLRQLGFEVIERINVNQKEMKRAITTFGQHLTEAGSDAVGLFYYAGHGVQVEGENYLIPVNVNIEVEADVDIESVSASSVHQQMAFAKNRLNIIIMDACRNNPFKRGFRAAGSGLAKMDASKGTLIAYATSPGAVAADGTGINSPYTEALSKALLTPGLTVERVFKQVRNEVVTATHDRQVPWEASSLTGADFYFNGGPKTQISVASKTSADAIFWSSIQHSQNLADFESFIKSYPSSPFSALAKTRVVALTPSWSVHIAATYEGEITNSVRAASDKVVTRLQLQDGTIVGTYDIFEPSGKSTGRLRNFADLGNKKATLQWQDRYGEGTLDLIFSDDFRTFKGTWKPSSGEAGGTWSGQR